MMTEALCLDTLPSEVLFAIFNFCHPFDLVRLSEVCTRFYSVIREDTLWTKKSKQSLVTNQISSRFCERCDPLLCLRTKWHVSHNWQYGKYQERVLFSQGTKLMPWLQLTGDRLWCSFGHQLYGFKQNASFGQFCYAFTRNTNRSDICKFIVKGECIVTGHRDGSLKFLTKSERDDKFSYLCIQRAHTRDVNAVDKSNEIVVSGSGDGIVKIWAVVDDEIVTAPLTTINIADRVWSTAIDPTGIKLAVGSSGTGAGPPLNIFDLECYSDSDILQHKWRRGAGILDMVWENPHTLLTCGYDTYVRKWDIRSGICVNSWADPTDASLYCISSDYRYSIVTGTQYNGKSVLWDQRQKNYVQLYFMKIRKASSPVYCIDFDSSHLYGATDQDLVELQFAGYNYEKKDYREILGYERQRSSWNSRNRTV